jgi:ribokinase
MNSTSPTVIVVGSINMDLVVTTPHIPAPGETVLGTQFLTMHGGKGANQAVAAATAGAEVSLVGRLGADAFGVELRAGLNEASVDVTHVGTCKHDPSGVALISVAASGENAIVVAPGANSLIRSAHIDDAVASGLFANANVMLAQLEIPLAVVLQAATAAKAAGCLVVLNPAPAQQLPDELLRLVDVLVANETELEMLGGIEHVSGIVPSVVATLGEAGVLIRSEGNSIELQALVVEVVDTTGAGDTCCGYLAAELARGLSLSTAAQRANVAAGLSVTRMGARSAPIPQEVDDAMVNLLAPQIP